MCHILLSDWCLDIPKQRPVGCARFPEPVLNNLAGMTCVEGAEYETIHVLRDYTCILQVLRNCTEIVLGLCYSATCIVCVLIMNLI